MNRRRKQPGRVAAKSAKVEDKKPEVIDESSDSEGPATLNIETLTADLKEKFLYSFPTEFFSFWMHVLRMAGKGDPCGVFESLRSLRLCGIFIYLAGRIKDADTEKCLLQDRYETDLPEMQTLAVYDGGRFVYWRDVPNTNKPLIVHVKNAEHYPKCEVVGDKDPYYMIAYLAGYRLTAANKKLFPKVWIENYNSLIGDAKKLAKARKKQTVGSPFHGIGISVEIVNNIGYRPLTETAVKLKEMITEAATTNDKSLKEKNMQKVMDVVTCVQFANDEKDYGMGLELGHDLFCANYEIFDKMALNVLKMAYTLLEREEFARILELHMAARRKNSK